MMQVDAGTNMIIIIDDPTCLYITVGGGGDET